MKLQAIIGALVSVIVSFAVGWFASASINRGEAAMAALMTGYSSLAYLQEGDAPNAMLILRASTEANLIEAEKLGDWQLWRRDPDAMSKWFVQYGKLREKLPDSTRAPIDPEFEKNVNEALKKATASAATKR
jgi:hypothetical protein